MHIPHGLDRCQYHQLKAQTRLPRLFLLSADQHHGAGKHDRVCRSFLLTAVENSSLRTTDSPKVVQITPRNNICHLKKSRGRKNKIWLFTLKLASTIILIYVKLPKMAMFRCQKNYVPIKLETWNFEHSLEVAPTNDDRNIKFVRYRESGFLKTRFRAPLSWDMYIYICI